MYEFLKSANDILFYAVAGIVIIGCLIKIIKKKNHDKKEDEKQ